MKPDEVLTKAIKKAIANGWQGHLNKSDTGLWVVFGRTHTLLDGAPPKEILFNHDFAKALWGQELEDAITGEKLYITAGPTRLPIWQEQLQAMVIADDPIAYLGEHL